MEVIAVILLIIIVVLIIGMRNDIAEIKSDISDVQSRLDDYCTNDDSVEENSINAMPPVIPPIPKVGRPEMPQPGDASLYSAGRRNSGNASATTGRTAASETAQHRASCRRKSV